MSLPPPPIILASASPRRRELLGLLGVEFEVHPGRDEEPLPARHSRPEELAARLARSKALSVADSHPQSLVLGADTIVVLGEELLGKPEDADDATAMLTRLSGQAHRVVTGVALVDTRVEPPSIQLDAASTEVRFRRLHPEEISAYVATGEPMDKAGAYAIQGRGAVLIEGISGDYTNVVGLPVPLVADLLRRAGISILGRLLAKGSSPPASLDSPDG